MKFNILYLEDLSIKQFMLGKGYGSLGHMTLRVVKSTIICHLFDDFLTKTILASQDEYFTSIIKPTFLNFYTTSLMYSLFPTSTLLFLRDARFMVGLMVRLWQTTIMFIPKMLRGA